MLVVMQDKKKIYLYKISIIESHLQNKMIEKYIKM